MKSTDHPLYNAPLSAYWKVPFREVYCTNLWYWVKATIWCHIVLRIFG